MSIAWILVACVCVGGDGAAADDSSVATKGEFQSAVKRGLPIVTAGARRYPEHRTCFSCHHQTLPLLAIATAKDVGQDIDEEIMASIVEFTHKSFASRRETLLAGESVGGRAITVAYGLWTFQVGGQQADDVTDAMVTNLLKIQESDGSWKPQSNRPPLEESRVFCTALSIYGLQQFARSTEQLAETTKAIECAGNWLNSAPRESNEDHVGRLWSLKLLGAAPEEISKSREAILQRQAEDGGWGQLTGMQSDAYATGQTLFVLVETGLAKTSPAWNRGVRFLLKTQLDDGSWFVKSRSKPIQVFFDNGDPHGSDQFISTAASSWAIAALAQGMRE